MYLSPYPRSQIHHGRTVIAPGIDNLRSKMIHDATPIASRRKYKPLGFHGNQQGPHADQPSSTLGILRHVRCSIALGWSKVTEFLHSPVVIDLPSRWNSLLKFLDRLGVFCGEIDVGSAIVCLSLLVQNVRYGSSVLGNRSQIHFPKLITPSNMNCN